MNTLINLVSRRCVSYPHLWLRQQNTLRGSCAQAKCGCEIFTFKATLNSSSALNRRFHNHSYDSLTCYRKNGTPAIKPSSSSRPVKGPYNFGGLTGTLSREHACPLPCLAALFSTPCRLTNIQKLVS